MNPKTICVRKIPGRRSLGDREMVLQRSMMARLARRAVRRKPSALAHVHVLIAFDTVSRLIRRFLSRIADLSQDIDCIYDGKKAKPGMRTGAIESLNQRLGEYQTTCHIIKIRY